MEEPVNLRTLTWKKCGISEDRRQELKYFAMQYQEKRHKTRKSSKRPPAEDAQRLQRMESDVRMIEEAARAAAAAGGSPEAWKAVLVSITEDKGFQEMEAWAESKKTPLPWSQADFYAVRRGAFYTLDKLQKIQSEKESLQWTKDWKQLRSGSRS